MYFRVLISYRRFLDCGCCAAFARNDKFSKPLNRVQRLLAIDDLIERGED